MFESLNYSLKFANIEIIETKSSNWVSKYAKFGYIAAVEYRKKG